MQKINLTKANRQQMESCLTSLVGQEVAEQVMECQREIMQKIMLTGEQVQSETTVANETTKPEPEPLKKTLHWAGEGAVKAAKAMLLPTTEQSKARLVVCGGCDQWTGTACKICGCYTKLKVKIPEEKCPLGKW